MNGPRARAVAILFLALLLLLFLLVPRGGLDAEAAFQMSFGWALRLAGGVLAVLAAVEILFLAIRRTTGDLPLVIAVLLAGLALSSTAWPAVLGLAALGICLVVVPLQTAAEAGAASATRRRTTRRKK